MNTARAVFVVMLIMALGIGALLFIGLPMSGMSSSTVSLPGAPANSKLADEVIAFAVSHDWAAELESAGIELSTSDLTELLDDMTKETIEVVERRLVLRFDYDVLQSIRTGRHPIHAALELIRVRLGVEAKALGYAGVSDAAYRRSIAWEMYGAGFDDRMRVFLDEVVPDEPDAELRADLTKLRTRLGD